MGKFIGALAKKQAIEYPALNGQQITDPQTLDFYQVIYDFTPQDPNFDMALSKGDNVAIIQKNDEGWWQGRKAKWKHGIRLRHYSPTRNRFGVSR